MFNRQKDYIAKIFYHILQQNLFIGIYFYLSSINSEQINVSRLNHYSPMNNAVTSKIKHFPQLFPLGPQIVLKQKCHYLLSWSIKIIKLDMYVYKYRDDYICKGLLQAIWSQ